MKKIFGGKYRQLYWESTNFTSKKTGFNLDEFGFENRNFISSSSGSFGDKICETNKFQLFGEFKNQSIF